MEIATEVTIDAKSETVWRILADTARYPQWNPYIPELHGTLAPGEPIGFRFSLAGNITVPAKARVLTVAVDRELRWAGHFLADWLFRAEHYHVLEPISEDGVRLRHGELFSGILAVALRPFLRLWAPGRYRAVNLALKQRAESTSVERKP
jgi:hypothetical protein